MTLGPQLLLAIAISFAIVYGAPAPNTNEDTLVLLHVLFRHGNRSPDTNSLIPKDINVKNTYYPFGLGQLTTKGKKTEYKIGQSLRNTYRNFLPNQLTPNVVDALATNFRRTKMSLDLVLASLFPPTKLDIFDSQQNWQPIAKNYEAIDGHNSIITVPSFNCPQYISAYNSYARSTTVQKSWNPYRRLFKELSDLSGLDIVSPKDVMGIYVTLKSEEDFGLPLPSWAEKYYPKIVEEVGAIDYETSTATSFLKKLSAGRLLKKIIEDSLLTRNGSAPADRKIYLYSAHEFNIATMMRLLNVFYRHVPPFGATLIFEVHNVNGQYGIKLLYQNYKSEDGNPTLLQIPGCDAICPLDQLLDLVKNDLPTDKDSCFSDTSKI